MPRPSDRPAVQPSREAFHEPVAPAITFDEPAAAAMTLDERPLFASSAPAPESASRGGMKIWLAAAASLVLGIAIGFASGYRAGEGAADAAALRDQGGAPSETAGAASGRTFSESPVGDPVRIEEAPIVPAPDPAGSAPATAGSTPGAGSAPTAPDRRGTRPTDTPPVGRVPPETRSNAGGPAAVPAGPGSIQVLSRPSGAQVTLDGRLIGKTPMLIPEVATGSHTIRLELATFNPWTTTVDVKAGDAVRVAASLEQ